MAYCKFFFFSSRRRHTRLQGDWSSDVCSSDLGRRNSNAARARIILARTPARQSLRRATSSAPRGINKRRTKWRTEERRVGKSVDLGGRRIIKKKKKIRDVRVVLNSVITTYDRR